MNNNICPVCFEVLYQNQKLSCSHIICIECINNMMKFRINQKALPCPLCRAPMNSTDRRWVLVSSNTTIDNKMDRLAKFIVYGGLAIGIIIFLFVKILIIPLIW